MEDNTFFITKKDNNIYYGYFDGDRPVELYCSPETTSGIVGNIYAARVERVAQDLGAAFLEIAPGVKCYYPLPKNGQKPVLLSPKHGDDDSAPLKLYGGDIILVQITKDAIKNKLPAADSTISINGKYTVITLSDMRFGISKIINSSQERKRLTDIAAPFVCDSFGIIMRTNAQNVPEEELIRELNRLTRAYKELMRRAIIAPGRTLLYQEQPHYITSPMDLPKDKLSRVVTDQKEIYDELKFYYQIWKDRDILSIIDYYDDEYPLWKLYRLETHYERALNKTVWLPSGGSLVIEPTEAMVVIDVNTSGVTKKKEKSEIKEDLFLQINCEAACEIARQLRLRNLSGIIVIDFINMRYETHKKKLLACLREECAKDRIKTNVVDITALNLVEMTRQKVRKPLHECVNRQRLKSAVELEDIYEMED